LFELVRDVNAAMDAQQVSKADARAIAERFAHFDQVLGVISLRRQEDAQPPVPVEEIERLMEERQAARRRRDFAQADAIRQTLDARGIILEDSPGGTRWKRK
jgi:cysteinyl-tRNA synthetase